MMCDGVSCHHCWGLDTWRGLRLVSNYPWRFVKSGRQDLVLQMHGNNPRNQSHVCTLYNNRLSGHKRQFSGNMNWQYAVTYHGFRGFIWPGVYVRRQCQSDIFRGWDHWLSLAFWLQGWVFFSFWFSGEHPGIVHDRRNFWKPQSCGTWMFT